jgi:hypothetical protein
MLKNIIILVIIAVIAGYAYQAMQTNEDPVAQDLPPLTGEVSE